MGRARSPADSGSVVNLSPESGGDDDARSSGGPILYGSCDGPVLFGTGDALALLVRDFLLLPAAWAKGGGFFWVLKVFERSNGLQFGECPGCGLFGSDLCERNA